MEPNSGQLRPSWAKVQIETHNGKLVTNMSIAQKQVRTDRGLLSMFQHDSSNLYMLCTSTIVAITSTSEPLHSWVPDRALLFEIITACLNFWSFFFLPSTHPDWYSKTLELSQPEPGRLYGNVAGTQTEYTHVVAGLSSC